MLAATTELNKAQKVKQYLAKHDLIDKDYLCVKELDRIYFPIVKKVKVPDAEVVDTKFKFEKKDKMPLVEDLLSKKLSKEEIEMLPKSQEIIGTIMILEIPEELRNKEKFIADCFLQSNKYVETVVRKDEFYSGVYRTRKVKVLAGKDNKISVHHENGVKMKVDVEETYFSARTSNERLRVAKLVKKNEEVMVMFSGVSPFPLVIAKNSEAKKIYGIEINPMAHQLALQNVEMNHFEDRIIIYEGDVRKVVPQFFPRKKFDRIVMPLPKTSEEFLDVALKLAKKNTFIHLYAFLSEEEIPPKKKEITKLCLKLGYKVRVLRAVKCGQFSPKTFRICFDMKVL